jgi:hypothetical protein
MAAQEMSAVPRREKQRTTGNLSAEPCPADVKRMGDATSKTQQKIQAPSERLKTESQAMLETDSLAMLEKLAAWPCSSKAPPGPLYLRSAAANKSPNTIREAAPK